MKKRGFTLIELLAVIIILAIIALIATPIIMRVIENSKKATVKRSAENYLKELEALVLAERANGNLIPDNIYQLDNNGDLCLNEECTKKLQVSMNGKKPNSGSVGISDSKIISTGTSIILDEYEFKIDEANNIIMKLCNVICKPVTTSELGNVPTGEYNYGDEYICNVNEKTSYHFYVLENGDTTKLTKETGGLAGTGEVALLMDSNLTTSTWCTDSDECYKDGKWDYSKGPLTALRKLREATKDWSYLTEEDIAMPTVNQIFSLTSWKLPPWGCKGLGTVNRSSSQYLLNKVQSSVAVIYPMSDGSCAPGTVDNSTQLRNIRPVIILKKIRFE